MKFMTFTGNPSSADINFDAPSKAPFRMLREWLAMADKLGITEPRAMVLSTVDRAHRPSSRVVILKDYYKNGIIFSTNQSSAKAKDLQMNAWASGTLYWRETVQQINFSGTAAPLSNKIADKIFQGWPRGAKAVAAISKKSAPLMDEKALENSVSNLINSNEAIGRPHGWRAYHLVIKSIEFWHGRENRLHKRLRYDLVDNVWRHQKLQP